MSLTVHLFVLSLSLSSDVVVAPNEQEEKTAREAAEARAAELEAQVKEAQAAAQSQVGPAGSSAVLPVSLQPCRSPRKRGRHLRATCAAVQEQRNTAYEAALTTEHTDLHHHQSSLTQCKACNLRIPLSAPQLLHHQAAEKVAAAEAERDALRAELDSQKAAAAEAAAAADSQRASLQSEVNTARQRIAAAEKARLELEVSTQSSSNHQVPLTVCGWRGSARRNGTSSASRSVQHEANLLAFFTKGGSLLPSMLYCASC